MPIYTRIGKVLGVLLTLSATASSAIGDSFVEAVSPPVLTRGQCTLVELNGNDLQGTTALWFSLPSKVIDAKLVEPSTTKHAVFRVDVRPDAPLGFYGLRLATRSGLSNVKLFLIDDLRTAREQITTPTKAQPQHLDWPIAVIGTSNEADVDLYSIDAKSGQRIAFEIVGSRLGQDFDPVVTIIDDKGRRLESRDNDVGLMFDCRFGHVFEKAGKYTIEVRDTRFRGSEFIHYVLRVGTFPEGRVAFPSAGRPGDSTALTIPGQKSFSTAIAIPKDETAGSFYQEIRRADDQGSAWVAFQTSTHENFLEQEPNDKAAVANVVLFPKVVHGTICSPDDRDTFELKLDSGQRLSAHIECRSLGSPADLAIALLDPAGKVLKHIDTLPDGEALFDIQSKTKGRHLLVVRSLTGEGGPEYIYRITIERHVPSVQLVADASELTIPRGTYQPLPLALSRVDYPGPVALALRGAPAGMTLRTNTIRENENESDNAIQVADPVSEGLYTVQVIAKIKADERDHDSIAKTFPLIDRLPKGRGPHGEPFELREDQRRLPPTLTERIAVLVTPRSPYNFELPQRTLVLPRYLDAKLRVVTSRLADFDQPITFRARGGSLEQLNLQMPRLKSEFPTATRESAEIAGSFRSGVNTELRTQRVTVTAHSEHNGRGIDLTRTFDVRVEVAYRPTPEKERIEIRPGESTSITLLANRLAPFQEAITVRPNGVEGWNLPSRLTFERGSERAELKFTVPTGTKPGTYRINLPASAHVGRFDEPVEGKPLDIIVPPPQPKGGQS